MQSDYDCICKNLSPLTTNVKLITCYSCKKISHAQCYQSNMTDVKTNFYCFPCRILNNDPSLQIKNIIYEADTIHPTRNFNYYCTFTIPDSSLAEMNTGKSSIILFFSKAKVENNKYIEWPSQNISLIVNEHIVNYHMRNGVILNKFINSGKNILKLEGILDFKCILGIYLCNTQISAKEVAKIIVDLNEVESDPKEAFLDMIKYHPDIFEKIISIKDPLLDRIINVPARGLNCKHLNCFDLLSFLNFNLKCGTENKWSCYICKSIIPWKELKIDHHLYFIIKQIKQLFDQTKLDTINFIQIDENGDWNLLDELPNQIERLQIKEKIANEEEIYKEPPLRKSIKRTELTITQCVDYYINIENECKSFQDSTKITEYIRNKMKELNFLKDFSAKKVYEFLQETRLLDIYNNFTSFFFTKVHIIENEDTTIQDIITRILHDKLHLLSTIIFTWVSNLDDILNISLYISTKNKTSNLDICILLELLLYFSQYMEYNETQINFPKNTMYHIFGNLLRLSYNRLEWSSQQIFYILGIIRTYIPDLIQPTTLFRYKTSYDLKTQNTCNNIWNNIIELISCITKDYQEDSFIMFMMKLYTPALEYLIDDNNKALAKYLYMMFKGILIQNHQYITYDKINQIFDKWDLNGYARLYLNSDNITLENIQEKI